MKPGITQSQLEQAHNDRYADEDPTDEDPTDEEIEEGERMEELAWEIEREHDREQQERDEAQEKSNS